MHSDSTQSWARRFWSRAPRFRSARGGSGPLGTPSDETLFLRKLWHSTRGRWQRFALVAFLLWAIYALALSPHGLLRLNSVRKQVQALESDVEELERRQACLDRLDSEMDLHEPFQMEKRAREDFGYARDNERIYVLPRDPEDDRCLTEGELRGGDRFSDRRFQP
ncbi:MAG: septum formation initiator family protein [Candidatus Eisenbacteria bacterium]